MNDTCVSCGRTVAGYDGAFYTDSKGASLGFHCGRCLAGAIAEARGVEPTYLEMPPMVMQDASGKDHRFFFRYIAAPPGSEAFEVIDGVPGGYQFQVLQEDDDPAIVFKLLSRMRRALAIQHLEPSDLEPGMQIRHDVVRGRIDCDPDGERVLTVVVDGQPISWDAFGRMLMAFEGWQFRLEILDRSEEP